MTNPWHGTRLHLEGVGEMVDARPIIQPWVSTLNLMQQSVLLAGIRGPDGIRKDHVSKKLARWLRRCVLIAAFDGIVYPVPYDPIDSGWKSGSFTGPSCYQTRTRTSDDPSRRMFIVDDCATVFYLSWQEAMNEVRVRYMKTLDELPHHYQLHLMHVAEIIGYKHPVVDISLWWHETYVALANDMHLNPETVEQMDYRLADNEAQWRDMERGVHADV